MQDFENFKKLLKPKPEWGRLATFVPNKKLPIYNWFYYKEGFSRDLVLKLIKYFNLKKGLVLDPFCGSGTTLLACKETGLDAVGFDVLPISVFASKVKTGNYNLKQLKKTVEWIFKENFKPMRINFPENFKKFFKKSILSDIAFFKNRIDQLEGPVKDFILLGFINSVMKTSWVWKDGGALKIKKHPVPSFRKFFKRVLRRMIKEYENFPKTGSVHIDFGDARKLKLGDETVDAIITSPPYLNQIDYTKVYKIENWFLGSAKPTLRSYLGLNNLEPVESYFQDMNQVLKEMYRVCKPGAKLGIVVGDAFVNNKPVDVDLKLAKAAHDIDFKVEKIFVLNKRYALKNRTIKVGVLRESLILLRK